LVRRGSLICSLFFLLVVSGPACTTLRSTLAQPPASPRQLSPDSEAHRRHTELELVLEQKAGQTDLITFIVDGTNRSVSKLARFSQSLYTNLARVFARRCPTRCLDAAWHILVHEVQPNVVVIAHGKERKNRLEVVGVYYIGERSTGGIESLSELAAEGITAKLLRKKATPPAS
jgi:hypothetical protein